MPLHRSLRIVGLAVLRGPGLEMASAEASVEAGLLAHKAADDPREGAAGSVDQDTSDDEQRGIDVGRSWIGWSSKHSDSDGAEGKPPEWNG